VTSNYFDLNGAIYLGADCHVNAACKAGTRNVNVFWKRRAIDLTDAGQSYLWIVLWLECSPNLTLLQGL